MHGRPAPLLLLLAIQACAAPVPFVELHADGTKSAEGHLERSLQQGLWTRYWDNGNKKAEGRYVDDVQVGHWTWWYRDGQKSAEGDFADEHFHGRWLYWHPNGRLHMAGFFDRGRKTGRWEVYDRDGRNLEAGQYEDGARTLQWRFLRSDQTVVGWFFRGRMVGRWRYQPESGETKVVDHGMPDDLELVHEPSRRAGFLVRGVRTGRWITWHETAGGRSEPGRPDAPPLRISGDFVEGVLRGDCRAYDPNGRLLAYGPVAAGRPAGAWRLRRGEGFAEEAVDPRTTPPVIWSGVWSKPDAFDEEHAMVGVETWIQELCAPPDRDLVLGEPPPNQANPPAGFLEQIERPQDPPAPRMILTRRELRDLSRWLEAYTRELVTGVWKTYEAEPARRDKAASRGLVGKVIDLSGRTAAGEEIAAAAGDRWTVLVLLRGFAGQVCPYCPIQMRAYAGFKEQLDKLGARLVAWYPGSRHDLETFRRAYADTFGAGESPPYEILYDVDSALPRQLGLLDTTTGSRILARPSTFILDPAGTIRYAYVGRHRADRPAAESLLSQLRELCR